MALRALSSWKEKKRMMPQRDKRVTKEHSNQSRMKRNYKKNDRQTSKPKARTPAGVSTYQGSLAQYNLELKLITNAHFPYYLTMLLA
jgi:hypothetical protein